MEKSHLWIVIVILIVVDIFSLYRFNTVKNSMSDLVVESSSNSYVSETFRNVNRAILFGDSIVTELPENGTSDNEIRFYFLFQGQDCTNCIVETWEMIEGFTRNKQLSEENVHLYYFNNNGIKLDDLVKGNGLRMDIEDVSRFNYEKTLIDADITISPLMLVAKGKEVIDAYQPEPGNLVTRDAFWRKWEKLLGI